MKRLMIFDLDGTVGNTLGSLASTCNLVLEDLGFAPLPEENFKYYAGDGSREMLKRCLRDAGDRNADLIEEAQVLYNKYFKTGCTKNISIYPGLLETLKQLKQCELMLAICTNKAQPYAESVIHALYGDGFFDYILGEQPHIKRKPSPEGVFKILKALAVTPEECVYVGDTRTDMETGLAAGILTVGVTWGFRSRQELEESHGDIIIDHPCQLLELTLDSTD